MTTQYSNVIDKLLFDYYAIHCRRKGDIYSPYPFYLTQDEYEKIIENIKIINKLSINILNNLNTSYKDYKDMIPDFPLKNKIFDLNRKVPEIFWTRYDCFFQNSGNVFFSEGNYDKPCAQRELATGEFFKCSNNVNAGFIKNFKKNFDFIKHRCFGDKQVSVLVLADPCHVEEVHLSMLYRDWLESNKVHVTFGGSSNICIKGREVYCFGNKIDIILRQFPTESLYEIKNAELLLELYNAGQILILNDPRVIALQSKTIFSYFHKLLSQNRVDEKTATAIKECIPYTAILSEQNITEAVINKNRYVIKPILGRYSEDVYIGKLFNRDDWLDVINYVKSNMSKYILQKFIEIRKDNVIELKNGYAHDVDAFCNLGVYLSNNEITGICSRWNYDYLTDNDTTFVTPIGILEPDLHIQYNEKIKDRISEFKKVNLDLVKMGFTGPYNNAREYISLDRAVLDAVKFQELKFASEKLLRIFSKISESIYNTSGTFDEVLSISSMKSSIYSPKDFEYLSILGRMDWTIDIDNNLKLLEINNETPAGLYESTAVNNYLISRYLPNMKNPNENFEDILESNFKEYILKYYPKTIGVFSTCYYEDYYNTDIVFNLINNIGKKYHIKVLKGNVYNLRIQSGKLFYFDNQIDMIYRYFPLNWFEEFNMKDVGNWINNKNCINQPITMIGQSKALFAVIYELARTNFFTQEEKKLIFKYIPYTDLSSEAFKTVDYICKPVLEREGSGVYTKEQLRADTNLDNYIFQERINIKTLRYTEYSTYDTKQKNLFPILGTFFSCNKFIGLYCRLGELVTKQKCMYIPTYIH